MIKGYFDQDGNPVVDCTVTIPELEINDQPLTMLISTGTGTSTLHPTDAERMGIKPKDTYTDGYYSKPFRATITFQQEQRAGPIACDLQHLRVRQPQNSYLKPMSVLGMDVLRNMTMHYEARSGMLQFTIEDP